MQAAIHKPTRPAKAATTTPMPPVEIPRTYTREEVLAMVKVSWRTIQRWVKKNGFPKPKKLSASTLVFLADPVDEWLLDRLA